MKARRALKSICVLPGKLLSLALTVLMCVPVQTLHAAPGVLSNVPLYMGTGAEPNVLWVVDDSGSMDYVILKRRAMDASGNDTGYPGYAVDGDLDFTPNGGNSKREFVELCLGYNAMAYNPSITYVPWVDSTGNFFPVHDVISGFGDVVSDPLNTSDTHDLSAAAYVTWIDADNDGNFDQGECGENNVVDEASATSSPRFQLVSNLSTDTEKQNYTNWYTYYRKRGYVMKAILSGVFSAAEDRFGLAPLKPNVWPNFYHGLPVGDMSVGSHKPDLINKLLNLPFEGITPLRVALVNAGKYFHQDDSSSPAYGFVGPTNSPASPIQYSCQANYTIMVTDGYRNETASSGNPIAALNINNYDRDATVEFNGGPYADNESNTMADLAMYYFSTDLDDGLENNFRSNNPDDTNSAQHMVTYAVAFGVDGNIDITPVPDSNGVLQAPPIANNWTVNQNEWPVDIQNDSRETIDDLYHATFNSRGRFFNSGDPDAMKSDIQEILDAIAEETEGTAAAVGVNSTSVSTDTLLFQAWFSTEEWSGELRAYKFGTTSISLPTSSTSTSTSTSTSSSGVASSSSSSSSGSASGSTSSSSSGGEIDFDNFVLEWEASDELASRDLTNDPRILLTWSGSEDTDGDATDAEGKGIVFDAPADFSTITAATVGVSGELNYKHLSDLLSHSHVVAAADNASKQTALNNLINWFKGNKTNEGTVFRARERLLGDIVSSSPQYVGTPSENYPNHIEGSSNPYLSFVSAQSTRTPMVYVGSNDGMLHAFNAEDGEEVFAYLPELLFTTAPAGRGYHELAEISYAHVPYVDGTPTVADVFVGGNWKTYLVGTLNGGGKGVFVLDVTDPEALIDATTPTPEDIVVGEFTHANLGYTYARAQIGRLNNGKWAAIFGNGYNNNGSGAASLFILYLDGSGYKEITTGVGTVANSDCSDSGSDCNGLSSSTILDLTGDGIIDRVYAGDLHGNMWAFDLTATDPDDWVIAHGTNNDEPLYTACRTSFTTICPVADRQPITAKPVVVGHTTERSLSTMPNLMVMFGTGQFISVNDPSNTDLQGFYGVWDAGQDHGSLQFNRLVEQTIGTTASTNEDGDSVTVRTITSTPVVYDEAATTGGAGWFVDLPTSGERMVLTPLIIGEFVAFVTSIPDSGVCTGGGSGWLMAANIFSGAEPNVRLFNEITGITAGIPLANLSGGIIGLEDKLIGADSVGDINVYEYNVGDPRPGTRASFKILR